MKRALLVALAAAAAAAIPAQAAAPTSAWDKEWLKTSLSGNRFEITGGRLALQKSSNTAVRALAQRLIADHTKSLNDGAKLAGTIGVKVPKGPTPSMVWELKMVSQLSGRSFDTWYSNLEVYDHSQDISEAKSEASEGTNPEVRKDAQKELPTLTMHLSLARRALSSAGGAAR